MALTTSIKKEIDEKTYEEQGDLYKIYISRSKNSKHSTEDRKYFEEIAHYALKVHNNNKPTVHKKNEEKDKEK